MFRLFQMFRPVDETTLSLEACYIANAVDAISTRV